MYFIAFFVIALIELYFFAMQRSSLEISRASNINPKEGRLMLPLWYILVWPIKIGKYFMAYLIYLNFNIWASLGCLAIPIIISTFMTIPHNYFISLFENKIEKENNSSIPTINPTQYLLLSNAIKNVKTALSQNSKA